MVQLEHLQEFVNFYLATPKTICQVKKQPPSNSLLLLTWQNQKRRPMTSPSICFPGHRPSWKPIHLVSCTYLFIWCHVRILLLYVLACRQRAAARGHGSVAAVNKKQRHQSDKMQQLMPADMHQLAAKTNRDALASSRQLDKMYRLGRGTMKRPRFSSKGKSTDTIYNVVDHESNPSHYQLSADIIVIHRRITSYKALQHWLTHLLH
jgi:hypothetical protein